MPLYESLIHYEWLAKNIEKFEILHAGKRLLGTEKHHAHIDLVDTTVGSVKPSEASNLVWCKSGALFGTRSEDVEPIQNMWKDITEIWGDTKEPLLYIGSLLMWRISLRSEQWFTYAQETGRKDPLTDKIITERHYWINEEIKVRNTMKDLERKFNDKRFR